MAINKEFFAPREAVKYNGIEVCDVRGITPDDLARIMVENAADVEQVFTMLERDDTLKDIAKDDPEAVMGAMKTHGKSFFNMLITKVPELIAKIIAVAADDPEGYDHIRKNFVLPVQLEAITTVAKLTFVDSNGFKAFLGNVLALAGKSDETTSATMIESPTASSGSSD